MKSLLLNMLQVTVAVFLAVKILRDFHQSIMKYDKQEEKESARDDQIANTSNDDHGTH